MGKIVDQWGKPIDSKVINEPQTASISSLQNEYLTASLDGLSPARVAATLRDADNGNLVVQSRLFSDMEDRDAHLASELGKRKLGLLGLDWNIVPPRNATAAEKAHAEWLTEVLTDAVVPIEDLILALMDGVGHGFAATELEWRQEGSELLPSFNPRPQEWFQLDQHRREIRLRDMTVDGAKLASFGWCFHTHGKAKTGYLSRMGIHRVLIWPFLYKAYAVGDFAEFLETFGLPMIIGKYFTSAGDEEKASLMRAVTALGHDARAIMPSEMEIEVKECTSSGSKSSHLEMVAWADRAISKAILGQTMSAEAQSTGLGSGNAALHAEVRRDILVADAREIAGTITRDLLYPLIALNRGNIDGLRRCPRMVFDTGEAEDIKLMADSLPALVNIGMEIPASWAHDKLRIPVRQGNEPVLQVKAQQPATTATPTDNPKASLAALSAQSEQIPPDVPLADQLAIAAQPQAEDLITFITQLVETSTDMASLQSALINAYGGLDTEELTRLMAAAFALAELKGMAAVQDEAK
ncbi:MAG: hypothetical protein RIR18_2465 [Pseudomonadota bacterium]|jgi:phage gp29-like protein